MWQKNSNTLLSGVLARKVNVEDEKAWRNIVFYNWHWNLQWEESARLLENISFSRESVDKLRYLDIITRCIHLKFRFREKFVWNDLRTVKREKLYIHCFFNAPNSWIRFARSSTRIKYICRARDTLSRYTKPQNIIASVWLWEAEQNC